MNIRHIVLAITFMLLSEALCFGDGHLNMTVSDSPGNEETMTDTLPDNILDEIFIVRHNPWDTVGVTYSQWPAQLGIPVLDRFPADSRALDSLPETKLSATIVESYLFQDKSTIYRDCDGDVYVYRAKGVVEINGIRFVITARYNSHYMDVFVTPNSDGNPYPPVLHIFRGTSDGYKIIDFRCLDDKIELTFINSQDNTRYSKQYILNGIFSIVSD